MPCSTNKSYEQMYKKIKENWDKIAKPLDSLGKFEELVCKLGAIQKQELPQCSKTALLVMCSDNGIVEEGISQSGQEVTKICSQNIAMGKTTVGIMAKQTNTEIFAYDVGINCSETVPGTINRKIRMGTRNFLLEPSMTKEECEKAIDFGISLVKEYKEKGFHLLCIGEMGIGNTCTSSAIASALLSLDAEKVTGPGAGLSNEALERKIRVVRTANEKYELKNKSAKEVLAYVGGYDIACMTGICLGAKKYSLPIILDGAISMVSALVAQRIEDGTVDYLLPSHISREPLVKKLCEELKIQPVIDGNMALGEGTGAVLFLGLLQTIIEVYKNSLSFSQSKVSQYTRFEV